MSTDLDGRLGHVQARCSFPYRLPFELHLDDRQAASVRKSLKQPGQIASGFGRCGVLRKEGAVARLLVQRLFDRAARRLRWQRAYQVVAPDGVEPRRQPLRRPVRVSLVVQGEQGFLHEILHVVRKRREAAAEIGPQVNAAARQESGIGRAVAVQGEQQQRAEAFLDVVQLAL